MLTKGLLVGAAACSLLFAQPQRADAGVRVSVDVTATNYAHEPSYRPVQYRPYHYDYDDDDEYEEDAITCWEGRRIVRRAGYRQVHTISCYGDIYRYRAIKNGFLWRVSVESDTGDIIRARKIRSVQHTYY